VPSPDRVAPTLLVHLRHARDHVDRHYREPLDLDVLAAVASVSKYHFVRCFEATYGETPMRYLTRRRIERAQDLLRAANLTVTEVCAGGLPRLVLDAVHAAGGRDADRLPRPLGRDRRCARARVLGVHARRSAIREKAVGTGPPYGGPMITNVALTTVYCLDQDVARDFYVDKLGFRARFDVTMGEFRWVTVHHPDHPELEITLMTPGPPLDPEAAEFVRRQLGKGQMGGLGLRVDDCRKTYEELSALGVEFLQEPAERPYGVEAVMRDVSGNWLVLIEPREFTPDQP
jgi:catechol 2,3-dioxygenase-like lactoylglutathione lyase family enzyme